MLAREHRLSRTQFNQVMQQGRVVHDELLALRVLRDKEFTVGKRFSFVISKKVAKAATARNKTRRRGYEIIHKHLDHIKDNVGVIIFLKKGAGTLSFTNFETALVALFKKSKLLK